MVLDPIDFLSKCEYFSRDRVAAAVAAGREQNTDFKADVGLLVRLQHRFRMATLYEGGQQKKSPNREWLSPTLPLYESDQESVVALANAGLLELRQVPSTLTWSPSLEMTAAQLSSTYAVELLMRYRLFSTWDTTHGTGPSNIRLARTTQLLQGNVLNAWALNADEVRYVAVRAAKPDWSRPRILDRAEHIRIKSPAVLALMLNLLPFNGTYDELLEVCDSVCAN